MMKYGWKPSQGNLGITPFVKSNTVAMLGAANGSNQYIIPEKTPISDQLTIGSCAANAGCDMWEILYGLENPNNVFQLSRLFLYWNARLYTQDTGKDAGTYIHNVMASLTKTGVCLESTWPYLVSKVFAQPNTIAYKEGDDNTFKAYYQITSFDEQRLTDIEAAVRANHPVIFGTLVNQEFENYMYGGEKVFDLPASTKGGHAMLVVGVRRNAAGQREFLLRNSWGIGWGLSSYPGHAWVTSDYLVDDITSDLFVGTKMDNLLL